MDESTPSTNAMSFDESEKESQDLEISQDESSNQFQDVDGADCDTEYDLEDGAEYDADGEADYESDNAGSDVSYDADYSSDDADYEPEDASYESDESLDFDGDFDSDDEDDSEYDSDYDDDSEFDTDEESDQGDVLDSAEGVTLSAEEMELRSDKVAALVEFMVVSIVDDLDKVTIDVTDSADNKTLIEIGVSQEDIGKIIGRKGRIIKAIRTLAHAAGSRQDIIAEVEVLG